MSQRRKGTCSRLHMWLASKPEATLPSQDLSSLHWRSKPSVGRMGWVPADMTLSSGKRSQESTKHKLCLAYTISPQAGSACNNIFIASSRKINLFKIATDFALGENVWYMQKREHCAFFKALPNLRTSGIVHRTHKKNCSSIFFLGRDRFKI